jgi:hypothetical protein
MFYFISWFFLRVKLFKLIPNGHMYFNVSTQEKKPSLYSLWNEIVGQNIWVKSFRCTLTTNWVSTFFVLKKKEINNHLITFMNYWFEIIIKTLKLIN